MSDLERRNERRNVRRSDEDSNCRPYVPIALALAFAGFGMPIGITSGMLVSVFLLMFPALILLALGTSKLQEKKQRSVPRSSARSRNYFLPSGTTAAANPNRGCDGGLATVREADGMVSELAGGGHLEVEGRNGALF